MNHRLYLVLGLILLLLWSAFSAAGDLRSGFVPAGALAGALPARAQAEDTPAETSNPAEPTPTLPQQEIPGDTTILFIAALLLVLIVLIGVLWHSRRPS